MPPWSRKRASTSLRCKCPNALREPGWRLVWATPSDAERGVFFFRKTGARYRLIDIWGGVIARDERAGTIAWARSRKGGGPSPRLAACFADALAAGK
jgi:hypothetical protein